MLAQGSVAEVQHGITNANSSEDGSAHAAAHDHVERNSPELIHTSNGRQQKSTSMDMSIVVSLNHDRHYHACAQPEDVSPCDSPQAK
jgi:hypothetical protein